MWSAGHNKVNNKCKIATNEHVWLEDPKAVVWPEAMPDGMSLNLVNGSRALIVTSPV